MNSPSCSIHRQCNSPPTGIPIYKSQIPPQQISSLLHPPPATAAVSTNFSTRHLSLLITIKRPFITLWHSFLHCIHCMSFIASWYSSLQMCYCSGEFTILQYSPTVRFTTDSAIHHRQASSSIKAESPPGFFFSSTSSSSSNTKTTHPSTLHRPYHYANYTSLHILYMTIPSLIVVVLNEHRSTLIFQYINIHKSPAQLHRQTTQWR